MSTPSDIAAHTTPWGHRLQTLEAWAEKGMHPQASMLTLEEILHTPKSAAAPAPEGRANFLVIFHSNLSFAVVLSALRCYADLHPNSDSFHYFIKQLAPKQQNVENAALAIGHILLVTPTWSDSKTFESTAVMDAVTSFELQSNVEDLHVSVCMPKVFLLQFFTFRL